MTNPTSKFIPDTAKDGGLLLTTNTAMHLADLMLRYGSVEAKLSHGSDSPLPNRLVFLASRQHSVFAAADYLIPTQLPNDHPYTFYNFAVLHEPSRMYQFHTTTIDPYIADSYMSDAERSAWSRFLTLLGKTINKLLKGKDYGAIDAEPDTSGRVRLKLRQREEV